MPTLRSVNGLSDIGRVRRRNEDALALHAAWGVAVVADGMGGHPGGDVASSIAATSAAIVLVEAMRASLDPGTFTDRLRDVMEEAVRTAHRDIRDRGAAEPHLDGMGTTLTAMVTHPRTGDWVIGHVGDSRAYRVHGGGIEQITRDDTWIQQQIDRDPSLDPARARHSPYAHLLTQCVGLENEPVPQVITGRAGSGDSFLLCSDGLVGMLEDEAMLAILKEGLGDERRGADGSIHALLAAANDAGGNDNITAALLRFADD